MKLFLLFLIPLFAFAKPAARKSKAPPKRVATKITSGKQVCDMVKKFTTAGFPAQTNIDFAVGKKFVAEGKLGAIDKNIGTFHLANLYLRAIAKGEEGLTYKEGCLKINFPDLDKDGIKDLELSVTMERLDPKANPKVVSTVNYERTFIYHPEQKIYEPMTGSPHPFVELVIK
ncbi:MAG: hypothetical protein AB7K68_01765 [Bacteriovoracia bacterium]